MKISCTIGVLTYNSQENLARALASVQDFAEIIIADGGSTDRTLEIAQLSGARIISQTNPGHPIVDFALERNRLLEAATSPWFFYLDSDEVMSPELVEVIRAIASSAAPYQAYRVRYLKTSADASKIYRTYKEYYQIRLVRTGVGAHFERPVHEHIVVPPAVRIGQTEASWYVPIKTEDLTFALILPKMWKRTRMEADQWQPRGAANIFLRVIGIPFARIGKSLVKMLAVKVRWGSDAIPARYELIRIIYSLMLSEQNFRRIFRQSANATL